MRARSHRVAAIFAIIISFFGVIFVFLFVVLFLFFLVWFFSKVDTMTRVWGEIF